MYWKRVRTFLHGSQWSRAHTRLAYITQKRWHCQGYPLSPFFGFLNACASAVHVPVATFTGQICSLDALFQLQGNLSGWRVCRIYCSTSLTSVFYFEFLKKGKIAAVWVKLKCGFQFREDSKDFKNVWSVTIPHFSPVSRDGSILQR